MGLRSFRYHTPCFSASDTATMIFLPHSSPQPITADKRTNPIYSPVTTCRPDRSVAIRRLPVLWLVPLHRGSYAGVDAVSPREFMGAWIDVL